MAQYDGSIRINTKIDSKEASARLMTLENRIVKTADKVASLRSKMDALRDVQVPTEQYKSIESDITKAEIELGKLIEKQAQMQAEGKNSGAAWDRLNQRIQASKDYIEYAKEEMQQLVNEGKAFTIGSDTQDYENLSQQLQYAENDLSALLQRQSEIVAKNSEDESSYVRLGKSVRNAFGKIGKGLLGIPVTLVKKGIDGLKAAFSGFGSIAQKSITSIASGLKKLVSSMLSFGKSTSGANTTLNGGLKSILKYGLGIRSLYALFNKLRTAIKEGFFNLYNDANMAAFKNQVDGLKASLATLKNAFAAAFLPLVNIAIPYIQKTIDALVSLMNIIGQFAAAITGQKNYTKAIKQTTAAINEESKAQNKQLSGLDKLNNLSSGGSGGGGEAGGGSMFEESPISSGILGIYQDIKDLIENEDWEGLGAYIANALNKGLQKIYDIINWNNVGPHITYFVNAFTKTFNSLVDYLDWDLLGKTIGAGINTIVNTLYLLITGIDWINLGKKIAEGINGLAKEVDVAKLGNLIGEKFMIIPKILLGFVSNLDWAAIGIQIGYALNGVVSAIDLSQIGEMLGKGLTGIFQSAINFAATFDWKALGTNIYQGINSFFTNTDWSVVGKGFSDIVKGLYDSLLVSIQGIDWKQIGKSVGTFLANIDWGTIIYNSLTLLFTLPQILWDTLSGAIQAIDWGKLVTDIATAIKKFFMEFDWPGWFYSLGEFIGSIFLAVFDIFGVLGQYIMDAIDSMREYFLGYIMESLSGLDKDANLLEIGWAIIQGMYNGILDTMATIGTWIYEHIFQPFIDGFKNAFGIHSPSTVMEEMGNFLMEGLFNGISALVDKVISIFTDIKEKIAEKWEYIKQNTLETWNNIRNSLSENWAGLKNYASEKFEGIKSRISEKWLSIRQNTASTWQNIQGNLSEKWEYIKNRAKSAFENTRENIANSWKNIKANTENTWSNIKSMAKNSANQVKNDVLDSWESMKSGALVIWNTIADAIKNPINAILSAVESLANGVINGINGMIGALNSLHFEVPDWIPGIGGKSFGFSLGTLPNVSIPKLATGAVIPANREFMAVLGDQKHGRNLEAPEDLIRQIVREETAKNNNFGGEITIKIPVEVEGRVLFELIKKFDLEQYRRTGKPSFQM